MTKLLDRLWSFAPDARDDATRRDFIVGGVAAGLLTVAGCGRDDNAATSPTTTVGDAAFPVAMEHRFV